MFLFKSAFWLAIAFVVIAPHGVDLGAGAKAVSAQAVDAGQDFIVAQIMESDCATLRCAGGKALLTVTGLSTPSLDPAMQDSSSSPVPFPRPRPAWMG